MIHKNNIGTEPREGLPNKLKKKKRRRTKVGILAFFCFSTRTKRIRIIKNTKNNVLLLLL